MTTAGGWVLGTLGVGLLLVAVAFGVGPPVGSAAGNPELPTLAPYLALAVAIERVWEMVFSAAESLFLAGGKLPGVPEKVAEAMCHLPTGSDDATRVATWQTHWDLLRKAPGYVTLKRAVILLGSVALGIVLCRLGNVRLFSALGLTMNVSLNVLLTGCIVGAGAKPAHDILGLLEAFRQFLPKPSPPRITGHGGRAAEAGQRGQDSSSAVNEGA